MKHYQGIRQEDRLPHEVMEWIKANISSGNKADILSVLARMLPLTRLGSTLHQDIVDTIVAITPEAGRAAPAETIDALSKSALWVGNEYIGHFGRSILILEKPALEADPDKALAAIEQSIMLCYSVILPRNIYGPGRCNDKCLEWQRHTFLTVINTIEANQKIINPTVVASVLQIAEIMSGMSRYLRDIHEKLTCMMHEVKPAELTWH